MLLAAARAVRCQEYGRGRWNSTALLMADSLPTPASSEGRTDGMSSSTRRLSVPRTKARSAAKSTKVPGVEA